MTTKKKVTVPNVQAPKGQSDHNYMFEFPASWGFQGDNLVILLNVPARSLTRLLASDCYGHALERSQRELNKNRVKKFTQYLAAAAKSGTPFIIPPLVGNCDCDVDLLPVGETNVGTIRFPMDAPIKLFDGQHRAEGIKAFCCNFDISLFVPIMLTVKLPLMTRKQFFCDINNNVSKPAAAINMAYDGRDDVAQMMVEYLRNHVIFSVITDFEHNIVPSKNPQYVSFKALCDATAKFMGSGEGRLKPEQVQSIWEAWIALTAIDDLYDTTNQAEYKKDYIQFHAVMINAFGYAVQQLLKEHQIKEVINLIFSLADKTDTWEKENFFKIPNWRNICVDVSKDKPSIIANVSAQKAAAAMLVSVINQQSL